MKNSRYSAIAYERQGSVSDMFVPQRVLISPVLASARRTPAFASALFLLIAIPALLYQGSTLSYFSDDERSTGNTFAAGPLDFIVIPDHSAAKLFLGQTGETFVLTASSTVGSLPFRYKVSGTASGNATFCAAISASGGAPLPYSGSIISFTTGDTDSLAQWSLVLSLPSPAPGVVDGQICILDLAFDAYQEGGAVGTEYHDTEHVILTLTADPPIAAPQSALILTPDVISELNDSTTTVKEGERTTEEASSTDPAPSQAELPPVGEATSSPALYESVTPEQITITDVSPEPQPDTPAQ